MKTPSPSRRLCTRAGIATLKIILLIPVVITLLVMVLEVANLWIARVEFENALESAALAAAKDWGDDHGASGTLTPREVGNEFAKSNTVRKTGVNLSSIDPSLNYDNSDPVNNPNQNTTYPNGVLLFGAITDLDPQVIFNA
ncbi:MAG: pilus assembly protein TadG-related protein, partial [Planctomycetota bacterium]|nr:pilus assembly protein TadG-related protein [Planctomycetota bacterium]